MTDLTKFVQSVKDRAALNQLIEDGELGRCEECHDVTAHKDADGEWVCDWCMSIDKPEHESNNAIYVKVD